MDLEPPRLDWKKVAGRIQARLAEFLTDSRAKGYVIGLSGGLDSSTAAWLCVKAVGRERLTGLILPDLKVTPQSDIADAQRLAKLIGVKALRVDIRRIYSAFSDGSPFYREDARIANGNLRARIRMSLLYYYANLEDALVLGTGDRSEMLIGYYTKYGDGACDILPLGDIYKTQVKKLARSLKLPISIVSKPSSPHLWIGHSAQDELGLDYDTIDMILYGTFDLELKPRVIADELQQPLAVVEGILQRFELTEHKRNVPPIVSMKGLR